MGHRFLGALLATLFAATGIASADCYVYGKDGLRPWDSNKCHTISGGFRCPSVATAVSFRDPNRGNGCVISVKSQGSNGRWDVAALSPRGWATWTCNIRQVGSNTYDIYPPH